MGNRRRTFTKSAHVTGRAPYRVFADTGFEGAANSWEGAMALARRMLVGARTVRIVDADRLACAYLGWADHELAPELPRDPLCAACGRDESEHGLRIVQARKVSRGDASVSTASVACARRVPLHELMYLVEPQTGEPAVRT